jgi:hypothetical protein
MDIIYDVKTVGYGHGSKKSGSGQNNYGATCNHRFFVLIIFLPVNVIVLTELYENENNKPKKV